jgi:DNA-binding transcriptional LysR family regulator
MPSQLDWYLQVNLKARQLRLLVALEDFGNLKQVADFSHVTVPAVSKALAELEKGLGLMLFTRTAQGLRPTVYGECLVRHARSIITDIQQARDELKALSSGSEGKINIGVYPASTSVLMPRALALLKQRSTSTNVQVTEGTSHTLLPQLWEGKVDLVVGRLPARTPSNGFEERELLEEQLLVVVGPKHPLARRKRMQWSDLETYPWVLPPPSSQMREPLERVLVQHDLPIDNNYIETMSVHLTRAYLYQTDAVAVMAHAAAHDASQPLVALPLTLPRMLRSTGVLWNRNRPLSPGTSLMIECLEEAAAAMREQGLPAAA